MFPLWDSIRSNKFPYINILLIISTIVVFILEVGASDPDTFINKYALIPSHVTLVHPATIVPFVTAIFLHGGLLHIVTNLWFLWVFGDDIEATFGSVGYLLLYFTAGILGNVLQYVLNPVSAIPMLGASGAIAGVLGAYFILFPSAKIKTLVPFFGFITFLDIPAPIMLGYWFILQLISGAVSLPGMIENGGIAFFAHIGGFLTGILFAKQIHQKQVGSISYG